MQFLQFFDVSKRFQAILVQLENHDLVVLVEAVDVDLSDAVLAQVELTQLTQLLEVLDFDDLVIASMENFELLQRTVLQAVQVLQLVAAHVEELKIGHAVKPPFEITILHARLHKECFNTVVAQLQDLQL